MRNIELCMAKNGDILLFHETTQTAIDDTKEGLPIKIKKTEYPHLSWTILLKKEKA